MEYNFQNCKLCNYFKNHTQSYKILTRALYNKYSSSQDFFYGKILNRFIYNESYPDVIQLKDENCEQDEEEYLKKFYFQQNQKTKMQDLTQYYKFHTEIPRIFMMPQSQVYFHDKKRRINYYKTKKILHEQQGNKDPIEITEEQSSFSSESSSPSQTFIQLSKFLKSHLIKSYIKKNDSTIKLKDTFQEINNQFQECSRLNIQEIEQYSQFLSETQITEESQLFHQNFIDRLKHMQKNHKNNDNIKIQQSSQQKKTIKFKQNPTHSKQNSIGTQTEMQIPLQIKLPDSFSKIQKVCFKKKMHTSKTTKNLDLKVYNNLKLIEKKQQELPNKKTKKLNLFRAQSQMNIENIVNKNVTQRKPSILFQQSLTRYLSSSKLQTQAKLKQQVFLSPNAVVKLKQTFKKFQSPQFHENKLEQFKENQRLNKKNPQSMQFTKEFQNQIQETDRLHKMLSVYATQKASLTKKSSQITFNISNKNK